MEEELYSQIMGDNRLPEQEVVNMWRSYVKIWVSETMQSFYSKWEAVGLEKDKLTEDALKDKAGILATMFNHFYLLTTGNPDEQQYYAAIIEEIIHFMQTYYDKVSMLHPESGCEIQAGKMLQNPCLGFEEKIRIFWGCIDDYSVHEKKLQWLDQVKRWVYITLNWWMEWGMVPREGQKNSTEDIKNRIYCFEKGLELWERNFEQDDVLCNEIKDIRKEVRAHVHGLKELESAPYPLSFTSRYWWPEWLGVNIIPDHQ